MSEVSVQLENLSVKAQQLSGKASQIVLSDVDTTDGYGDLIIFCITVLVLACFVGYYIIRSVTPALYSPLMGITSAMSSVIIVSALLSTGPVEATISKYLGLTTVVLVSVNIFGGFVVTNRMLSMFKKKS